MTARRPLLFLAALLSLGLSACVKPAAPNPFTPQGTRAGEGSVQVLIENLNFGDATVVASRGGERIRLGTVTGKSDQRFTVRWNFSLPMEFEITILGGDGCRVRPLPVDPGDRIFVRIPAQLSSQACYAGKSR